MHTDILSVADHWYWQVLFKYTTIWKYGSLKCIRFNKHRRAQCPSEEAAAIDGASPVWNGMCVHFNVCVYHMCVWGWVTQFYNPWNMSLLPGLITFIGMAFPNQTPFSCALLNISSHLIITFSSDTISFFFTDNTVYSVYTVSNVIYHVFFRLYLLKCTNIMLLFCYMSLKTKGHKQEMLTSYWLTTCYTYYTDFYLLFFCNTFNLYY